MFERKECFIKCFLFNTYFLSITLMLYASDCKPIYRSKILDNQLIKLIKEKHILNRKSNSANLIDQQFLNRSIDSFNSTDRQVPNQLTSSSVF
jgi:hypothetical protein